MSGLRFSAREVAGSDYTYNAAHEGSVQSGLSDYHCAFTSKFNYLPVRQFLKADMVVRMDSRDWNEKLMNKLSISSHFCQ